MFDNRWDNWAGDFAESFGATLLNPAIRGHVADVLIAFGTAAKKINPQFPDEVRPGTFMRVFSETITRLKLPDAARADAPEVIALFCEYLQESGRVADGEVWAGEMRMLADSSKIQIRNKADGGVKGVTIRKPANVSPLGRNDPCPCGSGKKYKKCCRDDG